jgi:hypothetical protein
VSDLEEFEAIKRLKYKYLRCLDTKDWPGLGETLTDDAVSAYSSGKYAFEGRDAILAFLQDALGRDTILSCHQVHHPELELESPNSATGVWALSDIVIDTQHKVTIRGAAFYSDRYVKIDGLWRIAATGYERIFEEIAPRPDEGGPRLTANRFAKGGS